jgi:cysteine synthase A
VLAKERPETKIVVCEPDNVPILGSGIPQARNDDGSPSASHPMFRPHLMQGWSPDFIPKLTEDTVAMDVIHKIVPVKGDDAMRLSRELACKEGIFVGVSSGATLAGALSVCEDAEPGTTVLCMLPDTGERYLSTPLFEDIPADMTAEEMEISKSTAGCRFDAPPPPAPAAASEPDAAVPVDALQFLQETINDSQNPVILFALEWCEFCWSVRKMFAKYEIDYRSIDLDSVKYQDGDMGGKIRAALKQEINSPTIPQIFVGGTYIGGATETFDACKDGSLQELLEKNQVSWNKDVDDDPYSFLPSWLHSR